MDKQIHVSEEDINRGERGSWEACPIALAMRRTLGLDVRVGGGFIDVMEAIPGGHLRLALARLPAAANDFIEDYDDGHTVKPFTFTPKPLSKRLLARNQEKRKPYGQAN